MSPSVINRIFAWLTDSIFVLFWIYCVISLVGSVLVSGKIHNINDFFTNSSSEWYHELSMVIVVWISYFIYQYLCHLTLHSATIGQSLLGIKIETTKNSNLFIRDFINFWCWLLLPFIKIKNGQTFYDKWFNVRVVRVDLKDHN